MCNLLWGGLHILKAHTVCIFDHGTFMVAPGGACVVTPGGHAWLLLGGHV